MKHGRNDPCPCGSGKKYKNCCLASERQRSEAPQELAWTRVRRAIDGVGRTLGVFVMEVYGRAAIERAWDDFTVWDGPAFDPESPLLPIFMPWLYHSWDPDPYEEPPAVPEPLLGRPPTRVFLERRAGRLDPLLERYLEACVATPFSFHEILRCDFGRGLRTRCVLTGEEHEVLERAAAESMQVGDVFFGQLVSIEGIVLLEACSPYVHSPAEKIAIIELREQMERERPDEDAFPGGPLREWEIEIRELYLALIEPVLDPRPPVMQNTDGELIELQRVIFDIDDAERALAALTQVPGVGGVHAERAADGRLGRVQFAWNKGGNRMHASGEGTVLAHVEITGATIVGHVSSAERARAFRELVEAALGATARFRGSVPVERDELDTELAGVGAEGAEANDLAALPEVREHLTRMLEQHYADWETQELPALGGRRPIDVVREPNGREKVEALLVDMERRAGRANGGLGAAALVRVRERLGLT